MNVAVHQLRVNVKSLAAEARFIREEIRRARTSEARDVLASHRSIRVKPEARMAHLALAFVKGVPYKKVEANAKTPPSCELLHRKIQRFTHTPDEKVYAWLDA